MKIERRKNASRNIISGFCLRMFQTLIPFLLRTVMIYIMGMEYAGLDNLFISILHVLNLAELGVGSVMVYSMYEPIASDDSTKIAALLNLYKLYYRIIGLLIMIVGLALMLILPKLISGHIPTGVNLYILYIINLSSTVASYWLFAYKTSLLMAHQRTDVSNKIQLASFFFRYSIQFFSLLVLKSIYLYFIAILLSQLLTNVITTIVVDKMYPGYKPKGSLTKDERKQINRQIRDLFTAKLGGTITNSADTIVISAFLGLTLLAKYNNYYYVLSAVFGFMTIIFQSCLAGIGNSLIVESQEKNYKDFKTFSLLLTWIIGYCTACLLCLIQPFMKLWVHEENMLGDSYVVLFAVYFYVYELALVWSTYKDAGGIWHKDRFRPLCVSIVNLGLNLLLVNYLGLYGVLLSTLISYVAVGMPWMLYNVFTNLFKRNACGYILEILFGVVTTGLACVISKFAVELVHEDTIIGLVIKGVIVTVVSNVIFFGMYSRTEEFSEVKSMMLRVKARFIRS